MPPCRYLTLPVGGAAFPLPLELRETKILQKKKKKKTFNLRTLVPCYCTRFRKWRVMFGRTRLRNIFYKTSRRKLWQPLLTAKKHSETKAKAILVFYVILVIPAGRDFTRITVYAIHSVQWKHLQILIPTLSKLDKYCFYFGKKNCHGNSSIKQFWFATLMTPNYSMFQLYENCTHLFGNTLWRRLQYLPRVSSQSMQSGSGAPPASLHGDVNATWAESKFNKLSTYILWLMFLFGGRSCWCCCMKLETPVMCKGGEKKNKPLALKWLLARLERGAVIDLKLRNSLSQSEPRPPWAWLWKRTNTLQRANRKSRCPPASTNKTESHSIGPFLVPQPHHLWPLTENGICLEMKRFCFASKTDPQINFSKFINLSLASNVSALLQ